MVGMKLSIERGTLLKALAQAQSVVERRNTIPILANVLIEAEGNQVSLSAGVESSDVHKRGPGEAVAQDQYLNEANAIRACMKDYLMKEDAGK